MKIQIKITLFVICYCFVVLPAASLVAQTDPNELGIDDNRDFKKSIVKYVQSTADLTFDVIFYQAPNLGNSVASLQILTIYISTDGNNAAEYQLKCWNTGFNVQRGQGGYFGGTPVYSGNSTLYRGKYSVKLPVKALELFPGSNNMSTVHYWFVGWRAGQGTDADKMPDSGKYVVKVQL